MPPPITTPSAATVPPGLLAQQALGAPAMPPAAGTRGGLAMAGVRAVVRLGLPRETRAAILKAVAAGVAPLVAENRVPLSTWASDHFEMDEESSHKRGRWEPFPFQIGWMNAFSDDRIVEVNVEKAKRVGYTKTLVAFAAYCAAHTRRKFGCYQPTDDDRDSFVKSEIQPCFDICKALNPVRRTGVDNDTMKFKRFRGSVQHYLGAKSARSFRRITLAAVALDEVDAMDQVVEKTIDPVTGAKGRLEGAPFPKLILGTTPRVKGMSHIRRRVDEANAVLRYHIDCPHCGVDHPLLWGGKDEPHGFKWDGQDPTTVRHVCPHCRGSITQAGYQAAWKQGRWVDRQGRYAYDHLQDQWLDGLGQPTTPPPHVAFVGVWTAYSPQRTWADIVLEFLQARKAQKQGDNGPMQGFVNETLAEVWEEEFEQTDAAALQARAARDIDLPLRVVPAGAAKVVMFIDTQADRWEATAWAVGRGREMWPIDHQVIYGTPAQQTEWAAKLDPLISTVYRNVHGVPMAIDAVGIDTQGSNWTHQAYNYVRERPHKPLYATKGEGALNHPIKMKPSVVDVNSRGKVIKRGLKLWRICTDTAKDLLHGMLQVKAQGPGFVHLNRHLPPEWFAQLVAERRVPVRTVRGREYRWECPAGHRNEALDCAVGALFLIEVLNLDKQTEATWQKWFIGLQPDLFSTPVPLEALAAVSQEEQQAPPPSAAPGTAAAPPPPTTQAQPNPSPRKPTTTVPRRWG